MQAIILAAGKGTRMGDLVRDLPKPMLTIAGKNLLEWKLDNLPEEITEVIIVVSYLKEKITEYFGNSYMGRKITYVEIEPRGTGYATWQCEHLIKDRCVILMGDDLYTKEAIRQALAHPLSITVKYFSEPRGGAISHDDNKNFTSINDASKVAGLINTGLYSITKKVFTFDLVEVPHNGTSKGELGLPYTLAEISKTMPVKVLETAAWYQVTKPEDLNPTEEVLQPFR
jgi:NDP-sugar pyrophosphorylase family protein